MESYVCIRKVTYIGFYINSTIIRLIDRALSSLVIIENGLRCIGRRSWQAFSGMHCNMFSDFYARHNVKTTVLKNTMRSAMNRKAVLQLDLCQRSNRSSWQSDLSRKGWAEIKPIADYLMMSTPFEQVTFQIWKNYTWKLVYNICQSQEKLFLDLKKDQIYFKLCRTPILFTLLLQMTTCNWKGNKVLIEYLPWI